MLLDAPVLCMPVVCVAVLAAPVLVAPLLATPVVLAAAVVLEDAPSSGSFADACSEESVARNEFASGAWMSLAARPASPGRMLEVLPISLPRPREHDLRNSPEFAAYRQRIWRLLETEVQQALGAQLQGSA